MLVNGTYDLKDADVEKHGFSIIRNNEEVSAYSISFTDVKYEVFYDKSIKKIWISRLTKEFIETEVAGIILLDSFDLDFILRRIWTYQLDLYQFTQNSHN